ncbi:MAG: Ig-like domain-containing protein [Pseudomonadota bacterium]
MQKRIVTIFIGLLFGLPGVSHSQIGVMPVPQIDTADIEVSVEILPAAGQQPTEYIYRYTVTNPITSADGLYKFSIDISSNSTTLGGLLPTLRTVPVRGGLATQPIAEEEQAFFPFLNGYEGRGIVPIGLECPPGWNGGLRRNATAVCYASADTPRIAPGESLSGFAVHSRLPPMLREVDTTAFWTVVVNDLEDDIEDIDREAAYQVLVGLRRPQMTIGPTFNFPREREHYIVFARDLFEMIDLGWIPNAQLAEEVSTIVQDAGDLFRTGQGSAAKLRLDDLVTAVDNAAAGDILPTAADSLTVSVSSIQEFGSNTFPSGGLDTQISFSPRTASLFLGSTFELEAFAFRLDNSNFRTGVIEVPDTTTTVFFGCDDSAPVDPGVDPCPNVPQGPSPQGLNPVPVDSNGIAIFSYVGTRPGQDNIRICIDSFCEGVLGRLKVNWTSDVDLVIQAFSPPLILAESGDLITFSDRTANLGGGSSAPSVTAYYLSDDEQVDPATAIFVGDRDVPALQPGEVSEIVGEQFELPAGIAMQPQFLIACADDEFEIEESNELNNCSNVPIEGYEFFAKPVADFDDLFAVTVNDVAVIEGDTGTADAILEFQLNQPNPDADISFDYSIVDGSAMVADNDYIGSDGNITFPAGTGGPDSRQISITVIGDTAIENDETVAVEITPLSGDATYRTLIATVTIVNDDSSSNSAPVANDQSVETNKNVPIPVVLTATDADDDVLTYQIVNPPSEGSLTGTAPDLTYTPDSDFVGQDAFTFKANDGAADSNTASVNIVVVDTDCTIRLDELVARDGSGQLEYTGSDQGKQGTGLRLTSMGRLLDQAAHPVFSVWRIRNTATFPQTVLLDAYNDPYEVFLDVPARTELFFASPISTGPATHRLFLGSTQVDVKAAGNQTFVNETEVQDPLCTP